MTWSSARWRAEGQPPPDEGAAELPRTKTARGCAGVTPLNLLRPAKGHFFSQRNGYRDVSGRRPGLQTGGADDARYQRDGDERLTAQDLRVSCGSRLGDTGVPQRIIYTRLGFTDAGPRVDAGDPPARVGAQPPLPHGVGVVGLEVMTLVMTEGRLPTLRVVRE